MKTDGLIHFTANIVAAHVENNAVSVAAVPDLIKSVHRAIAGLSTETLQPVEELKPAVTIRASIRPDTITCLECGVKQKMIKRHLSTAHGLTPEDYKAKWDLPADYPIVAPNYAIRRSELAKQNGLGTKGRGKIELPKGSKRSRK
ncbi:MucR family transcriptional regulator [Sphingomonas crocodyli]|uniref:Transcriptional regulator n=1 Tax=Sphingomonas crocodyli TaxID=1979270 RepID=A0A437LXU9_9SPHN|nr:MucR family transcriptional regulator [Sphingomonas crocodyli]RVT90202.1 transcriptional regulator [Sphingomonas crocodyli]